MKNSLSHLCLEFFPFFYHIEDFPSFPGFSQKRINRRKEVNASVYSSYKAKPGLLSGRHLFLQTRIIIDSTRSNYFINIKLTFDSSCNDLNSNVKWKVLVSPTYLRYVDAIFANMPHTAKGSGPFSPEFVNVHIQ